LRQTAGVARHLLWLLPIVALAACGSRAGGAGAPSSPALPPTVSAPATLLPDGTVPWVDEPAGEREFSLPPPARRVDPNAKPCLAGDLRGELTQWTAPGNSGEPGVPQREPPKLIGYARVANTGQQTCRLHGEVDTRLRDRTGELKIGYSHNVNDEAEQTQDHRPARRVGGPPPRLVRAVLRTPRRRTGTGDHPFRKTAANSAP
jgi:hypothetical protein